MSANILSALYGIDSLTAAPDGRYHPFAFPYFFSKQTVTSTIGKRENGKIPNLIQRKKQAALLNRKGQPFVCPAARKDCWLFPHAAPGLTAGFCALRGESNL